MSGIAGIVRFDGAPVEPGLIEAMTSAMACRGPDGISHWRADGIALGQCSLHTTPEALHEVLPLHSEQAPLVLVMDGRVDNWEGLRAELLASGATLRDRSDAELVLKSFQLWGKDCVQRIDGDFAFAIWNSATKTLFCARDRMGMRPFNYCRIGDAFAFASELHPLLALPWVPQEPNNGMVADWLACDFHSLEETMWVGISRLVAAHHMTVSRGAASPSRYWTPDLHSPISYARDEEYAEHYLALLTDIVRRTSRSHRPLAYEVSGGLDSSALFAIAADLGRQSRLLAPGMQGYTLAFPDDADANELEFSRAVAHHVGVPVQEVGPAFESLDWYRDFAAHYREFPGYPNTVMATGIEQLALAQGSRTIVSGVGGDEWLGGRGNSDAQGMVARSWQMIRAALVAQLSPAAKKYLRTRLSAHPPEVQRSGTWLAPPLARVLEQRGSSFRKAQETGDDMTSSQRAQLGTLHDPYHALAHEMQERLTASRGLDNRLPFQHSAMVQFAISTPDRLRRKDGLNKSLHRRAMTGLLPTLVLDRTSKAEFSTVFRQALGSTGETRALLAAQRHPDWVDSTSIPTQLQAAISAGDEGAWARWQLWALLVCDPVHAGNT